MYEIIKAIEGNTIGIKLSGKLTRQNYREIAMLLEQKIEKHGEINLLMRLEGFEGLELGVVWEDLKFDVKHRNDFDRVAVVGERDWMEWMTKLSDLFYAGEAKYFEPQQMDDAWQWVRATSPAAHVIN